MNTFIQRPKQPDILATFFRRHKSQGKFKNIYLEIYEVVENSRMLKQDSMPATANLKHTKIIETETNFKHF